MKIAFAGLGLMGRPMVARLLGAGHELFIVSGNADSTAYLGAQGAQPCDSIAEAAQQADVFCACRVTPEQSREIFLGNDGVLSAVRVPRLCIDFATIDPMTSRAIGEQLAAQDIDYLDAPVSGGPRGAVDGTLSVIVGGREEAVRKARPVLEALGKRVFHMGGIGAGVTAKLCNNMISIVTHALVAEAMVLGVKAGVEPRALYDVLFNSSGYSRTLERVVPNHFLPRDFDARATIDTIIKDLKGAMDLADEEQVELRLAGSAMSWFSETAAAGRNQQDIASVILAMEEAAGVKVGPA